MHKILIDTCVWINLAKDPEQQALLDTIQELIDMNELILVLPRIVVEEFEKNKEKIINESTKSLSGVLKRAKDLVYKFGDPEKKNNVLGQLNDLDFKIPTIGESVITSISRIQKLFNDSNIIETTDDIKLKAAQRAIEKKAPFHLNKNSINDTLLIEIYADFIRKNNSSDIVFSFVTHNKKDFSLPDGNDNIPHPDLSELFSGSHSKYYIKLSDAIQNICPDLITDIMRENEWNEEPRSLTEILDAIEEFTDRIWYDRSIVSEYKIKEGLEKEILPDIKKGMLASRKRVEAKYGGKKAMLNYYKNDIEWGMLNGKLSALRWVLGDDWDMLDT